MGDPNAGVNPIYRQLLNNLTAYGNGPIVIRIGGDSTDQTGEPEPGAVDAFAQLYHDVGAKFILGVNLGSGDRSLAADQAKAYVAGMPSGSISAIEVGNEPDTYYLNGLRSSNYSFANYLSEFAAWRSTLRPLLPTGVKLAAPASSSGWLPDLPALIGQESANLAMITLHSYVADRCQTPNIAADLLLQDYSATHGPDKFAPYVPLAQNAGLSFRIGEMNSIACGGYPGITDAFGSALWTADTMFGYANVRVSGVNFHNTNGFPHAAFSFHISTRASGNTYSLQIVHPLYYGMLFFAQATANRGKLVPVILTTKSNLKAWATLDAQRTLRVALINKDVAFPGIVEISAPGYSWATVSRLIAPSYQSTSGVSLSGLTFDKSTDGKPVGVAYEEMIKPAGGTYEVAVPITSGALITIHPL